MTRQDIENVKTEINRLNDRIYALERSTSLDYLWPSKETAAVRRASMDLTRALAEMRRSK